MRGLAALAVALHHAAWSFIPGFWGEIDRRIDMGTWGVFVFFMVSGYIIPTSLERSGDLRAFWIGRCFRLHPMVFAAGGLALLLACGGAFDLHPGLSRRPPPVVVLGHVTMLQELLGAPAIINVMWTLSYEMAFYLMVVALFTVGRQRGSAPMAVVIALVAIPAGLLLPKPVINGGADLPAVVLGITAILVIGMTTFGRGKARTASAVAGGVLAVVLVLLGSRSGAWQGAIVLAVMFAGTAVHRAEHGQIRWRTALVAIAVVLGSAAFAKDDSGWAPAVLLAAVFFALMYALRHRAFPRWLTHLGVISYSLYLLHPVLLQAALPVAAPAVLPLFFVVLIVLSHLTYRLVEAPAHRYGRRWTRPKAAAEICGRERSVVGSANAIVDQSSESRVVQR